MQQMAYATNKPSNIYGVTDALAIRSDPSYPLLWGFDPCNVNCHFCKMSGMTTVDRSMNCAGWFACLCLFTCTCLLFWIPFLIDTMNTYTHICSGCKKPLGARQNGRSVFY